MVMKKQKDNIPVANSFYGENKITPRSLYLYAYLHTRRNFFTRSTTITDLNIIMSEVKFVQKKQDNKKYVLEEIAQLQEKGYIIFSCNDIQKEVLEISFPFFDGGYDQIPYSVFRMTKNPDEFMVLCYIKKMKSRRGISFVEIADVLGSSPTTAKKIISAMEKKKMIVVNHGKYSPTNNKNDTNRYSINEHYSFSRNDFTMEEVEENDRAVYSADSEDFAIVESEKLVNTLQDDSKHYRLFGRDNDIDDIRSVIFNKGKIKDEHYFYVHDYKNVDTVVWEAFQKSKKALGSKFDWSGFESRYEKYLNQKAGQELLNRVGYFLVMDEGKVTYFSSQMNWEAYK
jgi:DNA-binding Lrp family transcriptional regulator